MPVSLDIRDADKAARIALLNAITEEVKTNEHISTLVELAKAYNFVVQTDAPQDAAKVRTA